jgi:shikimate kinase
VSSAPRNLVIVGMSGVGKSRVGRLVAERLRWRFVDTDMVIERQMGRSVQELFAAEGEERFRALEREVIVQAAQRAGTVISTGGGAILEPANREVLFAGNLVVCLDASVEQIAARLAHTRIRRPLLAGDDPIAAIRALKAQRRPLYDLAHRTIVTDGRTLGEVAADVIDVLREYR